jgi:serine/threonine protein kinase
MKSNENYTNTTYKALLPIKKEITNILLMSKCSGYTPPEYALCGHFSVKSDVFSFGVLVLEIVSGQKIITFRGEDNVEEGLLNYVSTINYLCLYTSFLILKVLLVIHIIGQGKTIISLQAWKNWRDGTTSNLVDPILHSDSTIEIMKCIHIGSLCVQENVVKRPTMASVVLMLNNDSLTLSIPSRPALIMDSYTRSEISQVELNPTPRVIDSKPSRGSPVQASVNEVSITELDACYV